VGGRVYSYTMHLDQGPDLGLTDHREVAVRKLYAFLVVTLDGFYEGPDGEFDWPNVDEEFYEFAIAQLRDTDLLVFGRRTYEGMASYWPTPAARQDDPVVAELMNTLPKVVVSTTLASADWNSSTVVGGDLAEGITRLKQRPGKGIGIFGSPTLTVSLIELGVVDELRVMVNPIALGDGHSLFRTARERLPLELHQARIFKSGNVLLTYRPT
jgi:dihydrofolate reductase